MIGSSYFTINPLTSENNGVNVGSSDSIFFNSDRKNVSRSRLKSDGKSSESAMSSADRAKRYMVSMGALKCAGRMIEATGKFS